MHWRHMYMKHEIRWTQLMLIFVGCLLVRYCYQFVVRFVWHVKVSISWFKNSEDMTYLFVWLPYMYAFLSHEILDNTLCLYSSPVPLFATLVLLPSTEYNIFSRGLINILTAFGYISKLCHWFWKRRNFQ